MRKIILVILTSILLSNCAYSPIHNPKTSRDKWSGDNIAGNFYENLQECEFLFKKTVKWNWGLPGDYNFMRTCMKDYGYSLLN